MSPPHGTPLDEPAPTAEILGLVTDALAWPLLLLRRDGTLLHANLSARQMLQRRGPLRLAAGHRVEPADPADRAAFDEALEAATAGASRLLHWAGHGRGVAATLVPLAAPGPAGRGAQGTLLLALGLAPGRTAELDAYAAQHGLSAAETRVLHRLALGESSTAAAAALGVAAATVRTQTLGLRRKTGHASVAELLNALATLPPLVVPPPPARR